MDNLALLSLLALAPILLVGVLLVGFRLPAMYAMPAVCLSCPKALRPPKRR